ncbi:MAG TPA: hypothetical protein VHK86_00180 [Nitrososphaera sp.]|nr:hypothetical protein [Nitrososphaera sp.]
MTSWFHQLADDVCLARMAIEIAAAVIIDAVLGPAFCIAKGSSVVRWQIHGAIPTTVAIPWLTSFELVT